MTSYENNPLFFVLVLFCFCFVLCFILHTHIFFFFLFTPRPLCSHDRSCLFPCPDQSVYLKFGKHPIGQCAVAAFFCCDQETHFFSWTSPETSSSPASSSNYMLHGASSDSCCLKMSYSESTECCFRSSLEVTTPVTLSWQQLCVFVRTPRVITKPSGSYYTQTHSSEVAAFCSVEESNNHSLLGEYCKNIDEILIGNGWNDREDCEVSSEATRGNQKQKENEEGVWDSDAGTSEGAFLSDDLTPPEPEVSQTKLFSENRNEHHLALPSARPRATLKCASDARVGTKKPRENQADGLKQSVSDHGVVYQSSTAAPGHTHRSQTVVVVGNQNENHPSDGREELPSSDANIILLVKDIPNYAMPSSYMEDIRNGSEVDLARETGPDHGEMTIVPHHGDG